MEPIPKLGNYKNTGKEISSIFSCMASLRLANPIQMGSNKNGNRYFQQRGQQKESSSEREHLIKYFKQKLL